MAGVHFNITGNANGYVAATRQAEAATEGMISKISNEAHKIDDVFKNLAASAGAFFVVQKAQELTTKIRDVRSEFQQLEIAFSTILKSEEKSAELMAQLTDTAAKTPFGLQDVAGGAKQLLAYGVAAEEVNDTLVMLGDIASGLSIPLNDLVYLYGTTMTQGRMFTQDLRQFQGRGIPIAEELAKIFGTTKDKVGDLVTAGKVGFDEMRKALQALTSEGGTFENLMAKQSASLGGMKSNLEDSIDMMMNELGQRLEGVMADGLQFANLMVENYEKIGKALISLAATYGTYRAALVAVSLQNKINMTILRQAVVQKHLAAMAGKTITAAEAKEAAMTVILQKAKQKLVFTVKALNKALMANPYVAIATAVVGLVGLIWSLSDGMTAAERAQEKLNASKEAAAEAERKHSEAVKNNLDILQDELSTTLQRNAALLALKSDYPKLFEQYDIENIKLADILQLKKDIAAEDEKRRRLNAANSLLTTKSMYEGYSSRVRSKEEYFSGNMALFEPFDLSLPNLRNKASEYGNLYNAKLDDYVNTFVLPSFSEYLKKAKPEELESLKERTIGSLGDTVDFWVDGLIGDVPLDKQTVFDLITSELNSRNQQPTYYSKAYKDAEKAWKDAKKLLEDIQKNKDKYTQKQYEDAKKDFEEKEKAAKELGVDVSGKDNSDKVRSAEEKVIKVEKEVAQKRRDQQAQLSARLEQLKIENESDIAAATDRQRKFNNKQELAQIKHDKEAYIEEYIKAERDKFNAAEEANAAKSKDYKKKTFDEAKAREQAKASQGAKTYDSIYTETQNKQNKKALDNERKAWQEYYIAYGTYKEKVLYLTQQYADKIAAAQTEGEKESLKAERDKVLGDLENSQDKAYQNIFKDPAKMTIDAINKAIALAQSKIKEIQSKTAKNDNDLADIKNLQEAIDKLQTYANSAPFANFGDGLDGVVSKLVLIDQLYKKIEEAKKSADKEAEDNYTEQYNAANEQLKKNLVGVGVDVFATGFAKASESMREIAEITDSLKLKTLADDMTSLSSSISNAVTNFASGGPEVMFASLIVDTLSRFIQNIQDFFTNGAANAKALKDFAQSIELLKFSIDDSDFSTMFGENKFAGIKQASANLTELRDKLDEVSYYSNKELVENLPGVIVAFATGEQVIGDIYVQAKGKGSKKNSGTLSKLFPELFDETGKLKVDKIEEAKEALETLKGMKLGDDNAIKALEENIGYAEVLKENADYLKQAAEDYLGSVGSSLGDAIVNSILKGEDALENFGDVAGGIIEQIAKDFASSWMIENYLNNFSDDMQAAMLSGDTSQMVGVVNDIVAGLPGVLDAATIATKEILDLTKGTDYDLYEKYAEERSSSAKGTVQASQDSVDEVKGIATNIQSHTFSINERVGSLVNISTQMLERLNGIESNTNRLATMENYLLSMSSDLSSLWSKVRGSL